MEDFKKNSQYFFNANKFNRKNSVNNKIIIKILTKLIYIDEIYKKK